MSETRYCAYCGAPLRRPDGRCGICRLEGRNSGAQPPRLPSRRTVERQLSFGDYVIALTMTVLMVGVVPFGRGYALLELLVTFPVVVYLMYGHESTSRGVFGNIIRLAFWILLGPMILAALGFAFLLFLCYGKAVFH